jgi:hypothetical protein
MDFIYVSPHLLENDPAPWLSIVSRKPGKQSVPEQTGFIRE